MKPPKKREFKKREPRPPAKLTESGMFEAAMLYLQRFSAPEAQLRKVLQRKVTRNQMRGGEVPAEVNSWIEKAVRKCVELKYVDDQVFTDSKIQSLRRQGRAGSFIAQTLQLKGVEKTMIQQSLSREKDSFEAEGEDVELLAAIRTVKRKRLGQDISPEGRQKDLAKLMRSGFSFDAAKKALTAAAATEKDVS